MQSRERALAIVRLSITRLRGDVARLLRMRGEYEADQAIVERKLLIEQINCRIEYFDMQIPEIQDAKAHDSEQRPAAGLLS